MVIVILFLTVLLVMSCVLPDFSISSLKEIASNAFASEPVKAEKKDRVPMRMPQTRKCKVVAAESSAAEE